MAASTLGPPHDIAAVGARLAAAPGAVAVRCLAPPPAMANRGSWPPPPRARWAGSRGQVAHRHGARIQRPVVAIAAAFDARSRSRGLVRRHRLDAETIAEIDTYRLPACLAFPTAQQLPPRSAPPGLACCGGRRNRPTAAR
jgi:hypothetical protein